MYAALLFDIGISRFSLSQFLCLFKTSSFQIVGLEHSDHALSAIRVHLDKFVNDFIHPLHTIFIAQHMDIGKVSHLHKPT